MITSEPEQTETNRLTRKQKEAIPHLIGARSLEEGREKARVAKATLYKWLKDETFKAEMERRREAVITEALDRLKLAVTQAVDGLTGLMDAQEKNIKIRACERVLEFFLKTKELDEIEARLSSIEHLVYEKRSYR